MLAWLKSLFRRPAVTSSVIAESLVTVSQDVVLKVELISNRDEEYARLHREATVRKDIKDWNGAIELLQQAKARAHGRDDLASALRLPLFLQQGGRYEEALREFSELLDSVMARARSDFAHQPEWIQEGWGRRNQHQILEKMALAARRQKCEDDRIRCEQEIAAVAPMIARFEARCRRHQKQLDKKRANESDQRER